MSEKFTLSEYFEAEDKKEQHAKGREEAKFFRHLLNTFKDKVTKQLLKKGVNENLGEIDINTTALKLRDFEFCGPAFLEGYLREAQEEVNKMVDEPIKGFVVNVEQIADMTPTEFVDYIESQKSSLIRD